jgi:serine/threonine protein kinase
VRRGGQHRHLESGAIADGAQSGTRLGPYEISAQLGVGGMGEVYRATDTNLKRQVTIKVLPAALAGDAERPARFQREAEVLAQLNHPNVAQTHGLERDDGHIALVMELVEVPTLADRLVQGALPVDEALLPAPPIPAVAPFQLGAAGSSTLIAGCVDEGLETRDITVIDCRDANLVRWIP